MAKATKTVKVRVAVVFNDKGEYRLHALARVRPLSNSKLIAETYDRTSGGRTRYPHACIVTIELPIPKLLVGKVLSVKAVKP